MMADGDQTTDDGQWHLDRRVPIALIVTIIFQTSMALWWASAVNTRVAQLEAQFTAMSPQSGQIIRLQTQLEAVSANILEIKNALLRGQKWSPRNE